MRKYKKIQRVLYVKHRLFGKWEPLIEHMKEKHPKEYKNLQLNKKRRREK